MCLKSCLFIFLCKCYQNCIITTYKQNCSLGPYVLAAGITTYVLSKEIWVVEHEFPYVLATIGLFYVGWKKFGASLADFLDKEIDVCIDCNYFY